MLKSSSTAAIVTAAQVHTDNGRLFRKARREERRAEREKEQRDFPAAKRKSRSLPRVPKAEEDAVAGTSRRVSGDLRVREDATRHTATPSSLSRHQHHYYRNPDRDSQQSMGVHQLPAYPPYYQQQQRRDGTRSALRSALSRSVTEMRLTTTKTTAEVPVLVDGTTTKWINGVTGQTTCDDVIEAILTRQQQGARKGKVGKNTRENLAPR